MRVVDRLAHAQDVAIGVADVHLAHAPGLVLRRTDHVEAVAQADGVRRVDVVDPDSQSHTASALVVQAQEQLAIARPDGPE